MISVDGKMVSCIQAGDVQDKAEVPAQNAQQRMEFDSITAHYYTVANQFAEHCGQNHRNYICVRDVCTSIILFCRG